MWSTCYALSIGYNRQGWACAKGLRLEGPDMFLELRGCQGVHGKVSKGLARVPVISHAF